MTEGDADSAGVRIHDATVATLPHVGHFVLRDAPTQVIPLVRDWLAR